MPKKPVLIYYLGLLVCLIAVFVLPSYGLEQPRILQNDDLTVTYETSLEGPASQLLELYPDLKQELVRTFSWSLDVRPHVILVKDAPAFRNLFRNDLFVAIAIPDKNLIVIDYSKMNQHPFTLRITFKHELCHLLLHHHIKGRYLARWLEEGICQWASDGIGEIFIDKHSSRLDAAMMTDRVLSLRRLANSFPRDRESLMLAYEQSKSVINFLDRKYGTDSILELLDHLKNDEHLDTAVLKTFGLKSAELEKDWLEHLQRTPRWLVYLANNLYGILFFLAAVLTIFGFIRRILRRKVWKSEEENIE